MTKTPRATPLPRNTASTFDPPWEIFFDAVVRYTSRTSIIHQLAGGHQIHYDRIKYAIDRRIAAMGADAPARPRGNPKSYASRVFMITQHDRFDGALLLALHSPQPDPGAQAPQSGYPEMNTALLDAAWKLLTVYQKYVNTLYPNQRHGYVPFDDYVQLVRGVEAGGVAVHTCRCCGARHPVNVTVPTVPPCPVCATLNLETDRWRGVLQQRLQQRRREVGYG